MTTRTMRAAVRGSEMISGIGFYGRRPLRTQSISCNLFPSSGLGTRHPEALLRSSLVHRGKQSFPEVRSQAGAWERVKIDSRQFALFAVTLCWFRRMVGLWTFEKT